MQSQLETIQPQGWIRPDLNRSIADTLGLSGLFGGPDPASRLHGSTDFGELVAQSCHLGVGTWLLSWGLIYELMSALDICGLYAD